MGDHQDWRKGARRKGDGTVLVHVPEQGLGLAPPPGKRTFSRYRSREVRLAEVLLSDCETAAASELTSLLRSGRRCIEQVQLPDIGDFGFDHRALSIVTTCDAETARLCLAAAMWLGEIGSRWCMQLADGRPGEPEVVSDDENMVAWPAPVKAFSVLKAWMDRRRAMVIVPRKDQPPHGYIFEPDMGTQP